MTEREARRAVNAIFEDIRDRRFLKWLMPKEAWRCGPILYERDGTPLMPISDEVQREIKKAWIKLLIDSSESKRPRT